MNTNDIQNLKAQLNEVRRWFYLSSEKMLGVDITGIPLPRVEPTVSGGIGDGIDLLHSYDYLEPTAFDLAQRESQMETLRDDAPLPKIYLAMGDFLNKSVQYLEARQDMAEGETPPGMPTRQRNLESALKAVEQAALSPPFPESKLFVEEVAHQACVAHKIITSDKPMTFEQAEMKLEQAAIRR